MWSTRPRECSRGPDPCVPGEAWGRLGDHQIPVGRQRIDRVPKPLTLPIAAHEQGERVIVVEPSSARTSRRWAGSGAKTAQSTPLGTVRTLAAICGKCSRSSADTPPETPHSSGVRLGR